MYYIQFEQDELAEEFKIRQEQPWLWADENEDNRLAQHDGEPISYFCVPCHRRHGVGECEQES